jgi:hypothetical protein
MQFSIQHRILDPVRGWHHSEKIKRLGAVPDFSGFSTAFQLESKGQLREPVKGRYLSAQQN